jgi:hypothetical protein
MPHIIAADPQAPVTVENLDDVILHLSPSFGPEGLATRRSIDAVEVTQAFAALEKAKKRVRVYSAAGFVPNSYRYNCDIQFVEATKTETGDWAWKVSWGRAQRSNGRAAKVVVS